MTINAFVGHVCDQAHVTDNTNYKNYQVIRVR